MTDELAYLLDRREIDDLLTRYANVLDSRRWGDLGTVFTPGRHPRLPLGRRHPRLIH